MKILIVSGDDAFAGSAVIALVAKAHLPETVRTAREALELIGSQRLPSRVRQLTDRMGHLAGQPEQKTGVIQGVLLDPAAVGPKDDLIETLKEMGPNALRIFVRARRGLPDLTHLSVTVLLFGTDPADFEGMAERFGAD